MRTSITRSQARKLLHNKFVVILGDSVQRAIYKDLVLLLQRDQYLTLSQLKTKGEISFEQDFLIEGGRLGFMNNGTEYREVRQYRSDHHLMRFYFLTRVFSSYMKSILEDFRRGIKPDVIIVSSCVWDISRYGPVSLGDYRENLHQFFSQIKNIVPLDCLILWNMAMPLGKKIKGGFLVPEVSHLGPSLRHDVIEANFFGCMTADEYSLDVLDLHFHFRLSLQHRMPDGVHWDALAHRHISSLLLHHVADAWGVDLHEPAASQGQVTPERSVPPHFEQSPFWSDRLELPQQNSHKLTVTHERSVPPHFEQSPFWSDRLELPQQNSHKLTVLQGYTDFERHTTRPERPHPRPLQDLGYQPPNTPNRFPEERGRQQLQYDRPSFDYRLHEGGDNGFRADDRCMRRRRRPNRTQPYPSHQPPHTPHRYPAYRW
ncbi:PC-esterase domain-containing protein 1A [Labrus mixtus]|uniref:PC-esterase domain-containing protein 1A n=1 Tax=Labrus mixtus TaxID=508554 RepID=UPI0029C0D3AD|nr:PC-esterase domain-containing protein 1A [Labrus mixtus]